MSDPEYDVVLLPSIADEEAVGEIAVRLREEAKLRSFVAGRPLESDAEWRSELDRAVDESETVAVFFGEQGAWSEVAGSIDRDVLRRARQNGKRIISVRLPGGTLPPEGDPSGGIRVDLEEDGGFARLVATIIGTEPDGPSDVDGGAVDIPRTDLVDEFATTFSSADDARAVLFQSGFPPSRIPVFNTSLVFWSTVIDEAENGVLLGGARAFAQAATTYYPSNPVFKKLLSSKPAIALPSGADSLLGLAKEFAAVFRDFKSAQSLLDDAGFPRSRMPRFEHPLTFWTTVIKGADDGIIKGGARTFVVEAAKHYPGNPVFREVLGRTGDETSNASSSQPGRSPSTTRVGAGIRMRRQVSDGDLDLAVDKIAPAIAEVLANADGELCFALYGPWGRGKTTLARLICDALINPKKESVPRYRDVWFNAWKYRSPPEVWAHLYESLALAGAREGPLARPAHAMRSNISRLGLWPLTLALVLLAVALLPFSTKLGGATWLFMQIASALGFLGAIWTVFAFRKTAGVVNRVWKLYGVLPSHRDKLGLQAAIGDDLRHLLRGWIWAPFMHPGRKETLGRELLASIKPAPGRAAAWSFGASVILVGAVILFVLATVPTPHPLVYLSVPASWVALVLYGGRWVLRDGSRVDRVLLVVDDLDRCPPDLMLEILESIKLLVEEPDVCERLQVLVLVDDEMLFRAVAARFEPYVQRAPVKGRNGLRRRLVREHLDKVFLGDFRLGRLSQHDVAELVKKFARAIPGADGSSSTTGAKIEGRSDHQADTGVPSEGSSPRSAPGKNDKRDPAPSKTVEAPKEGSDSPRETPVGAFAESEQTVLVEEIRGLIKEGSDHRIGPRAIKSMVLRYQLARLLLEKLEIAVEPRVIVKSIVDAACEDRKVKLESNLSSAKQTAAVIDQVAGINTFGIDL